MLDRHYFERVLPEQVSSVGLSVQVLVHLVGRGDVEVWQVFACHDNFVVLEIHPARERPGLVEGMKGQERWAFDQLAVPYENIEWTEITIRQPREDETREELGPIGFHTKK